MKHTYCKDALIVDYYNLTKSPKICEECILKNAFFERLSINIDVPDKDKFHIAILSLPKEIVEWAACNTVIISGDLGFWGRTSWIPKDTFIIYFPMTLWKKSQRLITAVVAHEIAHAYLGHFKVWNKKTSCEKEANELKAAWLYKV